MMNDPYVELRDNIHYMRGTRVSLESIILFWQQDQSPAELHEGFPTVTLAQVYGAIAYYLSHQAEIDKIFAENEVQYEAQSAAAEAADPAWYARMRKHMAEVDKRLQTETTPHSAVS